jgi:membrane associated rhomboid family serine protease
MMPEPPSPPQTPEVCFHHHDRETGRHCTRCGRPACAECLHQASVGSQCWECIKAARPPTRERVRRSMARPLIATQSIIALNVVAFVATAGYTANGNNLMNKWVEYGPSIAIDHEWWRLITSGFVHFGFLHIFFNMFILYLIGQVLEPFLGPWRFSALYFASLLAGALGAVYLDPLVPSGGASGAVFGVGAAATVVMVRRGVRFWDTGFGPLLLFNLILDKFFISNVSIGAHIGGMIGGAIIGYVMIQTDKSRYGTAIGYLVAFLVGAISFAGAIAVAHAKVP